MATRRKYRSRPDPIPADNGAAAAAPAPPIAPELASGGDAGPLQAALQAQQRAQELQHQAAQQPTLEHYIANLPISEHKRNFLRKYPIVVHHPEVMKSFNHHYQEGLRRGIPDDSRQMDDHLVANVTRDIQQHQATHPGHHQSVDEAAAELQREAEQHLAAHQPASTAPPPPKRSMPMSAPPSRDAPSVSGHRQPPGWNHLTAEERQIARNSFGDPNMSNEEKELLYLRNRQKLHRMRQDGSYSEQRG